MNLFDAKPRSDPKPSGQAESYWHFYDRVAGPYWDQVRTLLEEWFSHLGDETVRNSIRGRMRSGDNTNFRSALAELYVHENLIRTGFSLSYEPDLPGSTRRPDFLAQRGGESLIVEVTTRNTEVDPAGAKREAELHDALNRMTLEDFFLDFDVETRGPNSISARPLKRVITEWLSTLDPDEVGEKVSNGSFESIPKITFERDGWRIGFRALPVKKEARGIDRNRRAIGVSGTGARWVNDHQLIREALSDKTHAYGAIDCPFVIALSLDSFDRDDETAIALYGAPTIEIVEAADGTSLQRVGRTSDGYWLQVDRSGRSQVSGLLILPGVAPWGIANTSPTLWVHPNADRPAPVLPNWGVMSVVDAHLAFEDPKITPWSLFGLGSDWPIGAPFREALEN